MTDLLIIGGVAAGATAAARARRLDNEVRITLLEAGPDVSFANCGLPYFIGGDVEHRSSLLLSSPSTFHDQYRVDVHTNTEAVRIDREDRQVHTRDTATGANRIFRYDSLILAQGGTPVVPAIPGAGADHVFQLWTLNDMDRIVSSLDARGPQTAVVVGGGFIGLEMVEALARRGLSVSLVEMERQVMSNLDGEFAGFIAKELQDFGVALHLGNGVARIGDGHVCLEDGTRLEADMAILSVGVRPTLALARDAGLEIGEAGGLVVDELLRTSDPSIFGAGDMVEIRHRVSGRAIRMPLAGPANRQGRIAAENALGGARTYDGTAGTSIVKVFGAIAGSTGLSLAAARKAGYEADAVVVHKTSHTAYYPGAERVSLQVVFELETGRVLGAQAAGRVGVDKRLDVMATAIAANLTLSDLAELDLAYAPPFNSPNGPVNMAAMTAENHRTGFSPSVRASDLERFVAEHEPIAIDLRDPVTFARANLDGSTNLSHSRLRDDLGRIPRDQAILLISDDGQKGHVALRMLRGAGFDRVWNLSGGYVSLERHARALGYEKLDVGLMPLEPRTVSDHRDAVSAAEGDQPDDDDALGALPDGSEQLVIDVRTPTEFQTGAHPKAINIPLDDLSDSVGQLGALNREIVVYCASGARSSYAQRLLSQMGYTNVRNAGGLHDVMTAGAV